jgi:hypothetical protein
VGKLLWSMVDVCLRTTHCTYIPIVPLNRPWCWFNICPGYYSRKRELCKYSCRASLLSRNPRCARLVTYRQLDRCKVGARRPASPSPTPSALPRCGSNIASHTYVSDRRPRKTSNSTDLTENLRNFETVLRPGAPHPVNSLESCHTPGSVYLRASAVLFARGEWGCRSGAGCLDLIRQLYYEPAFQKQTALILIYRTTIDSTEK